MINLIDIYIARDIITEIDHISLCPLGSATIDTPLTANDRETLKEYCEIIIDHLKDTGIDYPIHVIRNRLIPETRNDTTTYRQFRNYFEEFENALRYDLKNVACFIITKEKTKYLMEDTLTPAIKEAFPDAIFDMDQARRCFALGLYTASVFHLMRILEIGLKRLSTELEINPDNKNWQNIIDQIESAVQSRSSKSGSNWKDLEKKYSEICTSFRLFKNAWRNHTMHAHQQYIEDSCKEIMDNVIKFMRDLTVLPVSTEKT